MVYKWALKRTGPLKTKFAPHLSYMLYYEMIYTTDDKKLLSELRKNAMQLEDYFEFLTEDDIRLKGTRVGIETVLYDYIHRERSPEIIASTRGLKSFHSLSDQCLSLVGPFEWLSH